MTLSTRWGLAVAVLVVIAIAAPAQAVSQDQAMGENTYYVVAAEPGAVAGIYSESNGCAGFQGQADDCDGDGQVEPADERVDSVPEAWTLAFDAIDEGWSTAFELVERAWDYTFCLIEYTWGTVIGSDPAWCGLP